MPDTAWRCLPSSRNVNSENVHVQSRLPRMHEHSFFGLLRPPRRRRSSRSFRFYCNADGTQDIMQKACATCVLLVIMPIMHVLFLLLYVVLVYV